MNSNPKNISRPFEIGESVTITTPTWETKSATIEARCWSFETLTGYIVRDENGHTRHTNTQLEAGFAG